VTVQAVRSVRALQDGRQLGISHTGLLSVCQLKEIGGVGGIGSVGRNKRDVKGVGLDVKNPHGPWGRSAIKNYMTRHTPIKQVIRLGQHEQQQTQRRHVTNLPGGADRSWSNTDLDDVRTSQQQLLHHLASHHIACIMYAHSLQ